MLPSGATSPAAHIVPARPASVHSAVSTQYLNGESGLCLLFGLSHRLLAPPPAFSAVVGKNTDFRESRVVLLIKYSTKECGFYTLRTSFALMSYFLFMSGQKSCRFVVCFFFYTVEK